MELPSKEQFSRRAVLLGSGALAFMRTPSKAFSQGPPVATDDRVMEKLSHYMAQARENILPEEVIEKAKQHMLDTLGAMISGVNLAPARVSLEFCRQFSKIPKGFPVVGTDLMCGPIEAAFTNGMLAHSDETDDSHSPSHSHPGCAVVPAALVAGQHFACSGTHLLRAITLGYDVGTRILMTMGGQQFQERTHHSAHSIANTFGAAAAAGCCAGLSGQQMRWLLDYAAQQASGIAAWQRDSQHVEKAFVFGGAPARNGIHAALLIALGATGVDDVFSGADNFLLAFAPEVSPAGLIDGLGSRFEITRTNIKKWTVGSPIQAPLDALNDILQRHSFSLEDLQSVTVRIAASEAKTVDDRKMSDISLQHLMAVMLVDRTVTFAGAHDATRLHDPRVLRERAKVRLEPDEELEKLYPQLVAIVIVVLNDGRTFTKRVDAVRGTVQNPMTREEVVAKTRDLAVPVLGPGQTERLISSVINLETVTDTNSLSSVLTRRSQSG